MLKAVLFDLDNTLLMFDEKAFFDAYGSRLYRYFADVLSPSEFSERLMLGTRAMIGNDGTRLNIDVFIETFGNRLMLNNGRIWERFNKFYQHEFQQLQSFMRTIPDVQAVINRIKQMGLQMAIATNPIFPMPVQKMRLAWAGLDYTMFDFISCVENSSFCKPRLEYYQELCHKLNVSATECLMVGNDVVNDMVAGKLDMKTFLTTDAADMSIEISRSLAGTERLGIPAPDFTGSIATLPDTIRGLLDLC